jgi:hypothetical protein
MRSKYINDKRDDINKDTPQGVETQFKGERSTFNLKPSAAFGTSYKHDENYQRQELNDY